MSFGKSTKKKTVLIEVDQPLVFKTILSSLSALIYNVTTRIHLIECLAV